MQMIAPTRQTDRHTDMTTTMNQITAAATPRDYWTLTAQFVAIHGDEFTPRCEEVCALTAKWNHHRFGLCSECDCGLDDESDFVITGNANEDDTSLMCCECFTTLTEGPTYAS